MIKALIHQKYIPEKEVQKARWLSQEALQIAEKRREVKGKGEKERYIHLNAEFQRIAGEIRKPSSVISAKKQRKRAEWERLEISSRKSDTQGNISCKDRHDKGQKWYGPNRRYYEEVTRIHRRTIQKRSQ